jgi:hypothetical protein
MNKETRKFIWGLILFIMTAIRFSVLDSTLTGLSYFAPFILWSIIGFIGAIYINKGL